MLNLQSALRKDKTTAPGATLEHRHFAFIAATLADNRPSPIGATALSANQRSQLAQWEYTVNAFARACESTNPRFDRARFLRACGVGE